MELPGLSVGIYASWSVLGIRLSLSMYLFVGFAFRKEWEPVAAAATAATHCGSMSLLPGWIQWMRVKGMAGLSFAQSFRDL